MPGKRRAFTIDFKKEVVAEYLGGETLHRVARRRHVDPGLLRIWVEKAEAGEFDGEAASAELVSAYERRIGALERLVGGQALVLYHRPCGLTFAQRREVVVATVAGSSMKKFQASQQASAMSGQPSKTVLESPLPRRYSQTFASAQPRPPRRPARQASIERRDQAEIARALQPGVAAVALVQRHAPVGAAPRSRAHQARVMQPELEPGIAELEAVARLQPRSEHPINSPASAHESSLRFHLSRTSSNFAILRSSSHAVRFIASPPRRDTEPDNARATQPGHPMCYRQSGIAPLCFAREPSRSVQLREEPLARS